MQVQNRLNKEQGLDKIKYFCAYQERCHLEVKEKLYGYGLRKNDVEEIIGYLIENNFLNEERFAKLFAGSKFRVKQWGRKKIQYELKQKGISTYLVNLSLKEIDEDDYCDALFKLAEKKWKSLKGQQYLVRQSKTFNFLLQKGYETAYINKAISQIKQ